ncbi:MAG: T9SS type A sorting domain-containing protein, partial [Ignavibacteria bacterium]
PFNPSTKIKFDIPPNSASNSSNVKLTVFDINGREVAILADKDLQPGKYELEWNAGSLSSGVYFAKLSYGNLLKSLKMILSK